MTTPHQQKALKLAAKTCELSAREIEQIANVAQHGPALEKEEAMSVEELAEKYKREAESKRGRWADLLGSDEY